MPGFRKKLGPEMVKQLASYVRGLGGNPPIDVTKKLSGTESASEPAPAEPVKPAVQVKDKTIPTVQPAKQVQFQDDRKTGDTHKASPFARLSSAIIPARKSHPGTELVDLNSASKETLMTLPGITDADAANIIAGRPYRSSLQFETRRIVSAETYARIFGSSSRKKASANNTTTRPQ